MNSSQPTRGFVQNIFFHLIRSLYIIFVVSRACVYKTYNYFAPAQKQILQKAPPDYDKIYKKYIDIYAIPEKNPEANLNIDNDLYDYEKRKEIFAEENNDCEQHWKRKLLYESTQRGNVIVYYNPYKHAFMYYSDEYSIPYQLMQYIAKKYVVMFRCRDFYIDPETYPDNKILDVMRKEEEALNVKSKKVKDITKCIDKDLNMNNKDIFASLKSYKTDVVEKIVTSKQVATNKPGNQNKTKQSTKNIFSNTFVRLGKTCEFNIIQKPPDKNIAIVNSLLFGENNIGKTMDFFDHLEITDNTVENPFSVDLLSGLKESKTPIKEEKKDTESAPQNVDALSKAKSWKEFKNLSRS
jgi:hypothetical protein